MADGTTLNVGAAGDIIDTDDLGGGLKIQRVKVAFGADGSKTEVTDTDGGRLPVKVSMAATATRTTVADSAAAVTLLAANANRKGAVVLNTSSALLYVGMGTVDPTTTEYTVPLSQFQGWEAPACFTGVLKGIWGTDPNDGGANVTELT